MFDVSSFKSLKCELVLSNKFSEFYPKGPTAEQWNCCMFYFDIHWPLHRNPLNLEDISICKTFFQTLVYYLKEVFEK